MIDHNLLALLPAHTQQGRARLEALRNLTVQPAEPTSIVDFNSAGRLLIIGESDTALQAAQSLRDKLECLVLTPGPGNANVAQPTADRVMVAHGSLAKLSGHLGKFAATVKVDGKELNLAQLLGRQVTHFDLVLDLQAEPHIRREVPPLGYYAPAGDPGRLEYAIEALPALVGEFEKPKFFDYNADICAHGRSGKQGCTRCLDACPTLAIRSLGERVEIDPNLCQGAGSCATACPTGAIRYAYPAVSDQLNVMRTMLRRYRELGGTNPVVLLFDADAGTRAFEDAAANLDEAILPFQVEEAGSTGMDTWLAALAYGACQVLILVTESTPPSVLRELSLQMSYTSTILEGMGYSRERVMLVCDGANATASITTACRAFDDPVSVIAAGFAGLDEKRTTLRLALDHLYRQAPNPQPAVVLPAGAPFGEVWVDREQCTLCMACVSQCPAGALLSGDELPQLRFIEANCVQCGLCAHSCPENAIGPSPRYLYDSEQRRKIRVLYEEEPFCCIACGKPFATLKVIEHMTRKLHGHWMFQDERALRRLKMCDQCRVIDIFDDGEADVDNKTDSSEC